MKDYHHLVLHNYTNNSILLKQYKTLYSQHQKHEYSTTDYSYSVKYQIELNLHTLMLFNAINLRGQKLK